MTFSSNEEAKAFMDWIESVPMSEALTADALELLHDLWKRALWPRYQLLQVAS